jgi:hypothetical protein
METAHDFTQVPYRLAKELRPNILFEADAEDKRRKSDEVAG